MRYFSSSTTKLLYGAVFLAFSIFDTSVFRADEITKINLAQEISVTDEVRSKVKYSTYILGPGDLLQIELLDLPELSGQFNIGLDGTIYMPRLRALYVEGLSVEELRVFLTNQYKAYVHDPKIYIRPIRYRPIRIYVGGQVNRPGFYTLSQSSQLSNLSESAESKRSQLGNVGDITRPGLSQTSNEGGSISQNNIITFGSVFPTVFDAIRSAQGITPYSDLSNVNVTRRLSIGQGGGRIRTKLNFISLISDGDESQNIRLFDGDSVTVGKSNKVLRDQILKAGQTNLTPQFLQVYVSGRVEEPGLITLPQGSSLVQAVDLAGGPRVLHGNLEFIRFTRQGEIDRRVFKFNPLASSGDYRNPVLMSGDMIRFKTTLLTKGISVFSEITQPAVGVYSIYTLFDGFSQ